MKQKAILFVDNSQAYLDVHAKLLAKSGYRVHRAYSLAQAEEKLDFHHVHLVILDVRMEDDNDEQDISGLYWAQRDKYRPIPKIILTAYPSFELAREALGPRLDSLPPAVNFIGKAEGFDAILGAVQRVFTEHVRLNWQINIRWAKQPKLSLAHLVTLIEPTLDNVYLSSRVDELEDLFACLFYKSKQINIDCLFTASQNKVSLALYTFSDEGLLARYVIICGLRENIQREEANHEKFASRTATAGSTAKSCQPIETTHYAALAYTLTDGQLEHIVTLAEFYRHNRPEAIIAILDYLIDHTLAHYHQQNAKVTDSLSIIETFQPYFANPAWLTRSTLETSIDTLQSEVILDDFARFDETSLKLLGDLVEGVISVEGSIKWGVVHGYLSGYNILVDHRRRAWMIDFERLAQGPLVYSFVALETAIKFDLAANLDYQDRKKLETYLNIGPTLAEDMIDDDLSQDARKALIVINHLRRRATQRLGQTFKVYQVGLLLKTLEQLTLYKATNYYFSSELAIYFHALNSIREICKQLSPPPPEYDKPHSPWLNEGKPGYDVWVEGQWVNLAEMEYKLLLVLYRQAVNHPDNPRCRFSTIGQGIWGDYERLRDYNNLQSLVRRVRDRIQPEGDDAHQYIENIRSVGYSLMLKQH